MHKEAKANRKAWADALRQTRCEKSKLWMHYFHNNIEYMDPLGVLCKLVAETGIITVERLTFRNTIIFSYQGATQVAAPAASSWVGLRTSGGLFGETSICQVGWEADFAHAADIIESEPEGLFLATP